MSGGGYGQQQWGGQTGGGMGMAVNRPNPWGAQTGGNMYQQPQPIGGMAGGNMPDPGLAPPRWDAGIEPPGVLIGGRGTDTGIEPPGVLTGVDPWGGQTGGNMGDPMKGYMNLRSGGLGGNMVQGGAMGAPPWGAQTGGNMDYAVNMPSGSMGAAPWGGQTGGNMGDPMKGYMNLRSGGLGGNMVQGGGMGSVAQPVGSYGDYMNRRNAWIDQLRGYVMPPQSIGGGRGPSPPAPGTPAPPRGGPPTPTPRKDAPAGVDHAANFQQLMREDPTGRLASEYRTRNGDTIGWWQNQMQSGAAPGLFGGSQQMLDWNRSTSPLSSNTAPLTMDEMMRLNKMAGISGPSWMR